LICGENRISEMAHFPKRKRAGDEGKYTIFLCLTHHRLLDSGRLSKGDFERIMSAFENESDERFSNACEFIDWAHQNGYPYDLGNLQKKFWSYSTKRFG